MTDDRSLERAARSFIEAGPTEVPDRVVEAALLTIQSTPQERDWHVPWRTRPMTQTIRFLAGAVAIALVVGGGVLLLRPGSGSDVGGRPSQTPSATPSGPLTACGLISSDEVMALGGNPGIGALPTESGAGAETTCTFRDGGGNIIVRLTYTKPGGQAAFGAAKAAAGVQVLNDIGTDAVFDPASKTLYLAKGDAMVAIMAGTTAVTPAGGVDVATPYAKLVAGRI